MSNAEAWQPLLDGTVRSQALEGLHAVAEALRSPPPTPASNGVTPEAATGRNLGLLTGRAGIAVFFGYVAKAGLLADAEDWARRFLVEAEAGIATCRMGPSLCEGFTGIAWAHAHLHRHVFGERNRGELKEIDEALIALVHDWSRPEAFDLLYGLVGIGVYALERLPGRAGKTLAGLVVERLDHSADSPEGLAAWPTPPGELALHRQGDFNLGMAHGAPGVVGFLGRALAAGIKPRLTGPLLSRATQWLLRRRLPKGAGSEYPEYCELDGASGPGARTAWCYGDPGVAAALLAAGAAMKNHHWHLEAIEVARSAARRPANQSRVLDAGLCHGSAGLAHTFNRLSQGGNQPLLREAAVAWFERTLDYRRHGSGVGGFLAMARPSATALHEVADPGMLTGAAGIGLALLAAATPVAPAWDRVLLLDSPGSTATTRARG